MTPANGCRPALNAEHAAAVCQGPRPPSRGSARRGECVPGERRAQPRARPAPRLLAPPRSGRAEGAAALLAPPRRGTPPPSALRAERGAASPGCGAGCAAARCRGPGDPPASRPRLAQSRPQCALAPGEPWGASGRTQAGGRGAGGEDWGRQEEVLDAFGSGKRSLRSCRGARLPAHPANPPQARPEKECERVNKGRVSPPKPDPHKKANSTAENTAPFSPPDAPPSLLGHPTAILASDWQDLSFRSHHWEGRACLGLAVRTWPSHLPYLRGQDSTRQGPVLFVSINLSSNLKGLLKNGTTSPSTDVHPKPGMAFHINPCYTG